MPQVYNVPMDIWVHYVLGKLRLTALENTEIWFSDIRTRHILKSLMPDDNVHTILLREGQFPTLTLYICHHSRVTSFAQFLRDQHLPT